ncbi:secreted protein [Candidatus Desulfofervidus auxilii]|uniref:Secreted protein n=1 Tax=Desulfofervidus auxilii TaxID=1621989 RepID=A0A7U4QKS4_DESA2|nr:secreted protein [Candidatus Desulfofervidus auxilii]CAD7777080.1 hypothetical protein BLFGPEAP_01602 [Candidatus Methanoperedenaceae archaeon GB50]CAD7777561.1 MAG: hypothetical protein KIIPBIDF_00895 [Candidatus Methanoperedenaceae archaeon GB50]
MKRQVMWLFILLMVAISCTVQACSPPPSCRVCCYRPWVPRPHISVHWEIDSYGIWVPDPWRCRPWHRIWVPGHFNRWGIWVPGHWRRYP